MGSVDGSCEMGLELGVLEGCEVGLVLGSVDGCCEIGLELGVLEG